MALAAAVSLSAFLEVRIALRCVCALHCALLQQFIVLCADGKTFEDVQLALSAFRASISGGECDIECVAHRVAIDCEGLTVRCIAAAE